MRKQYSYEIEKVLSNVHPSIIQSKISELATKGYKLKQVIPDYIYYEVISSSCDSMLKHECTLLVFEYEHELDI